jgi:acyl-CoA synthetase (AMP-forming)/AMP-acid ligase II
VAERVAVAWQRRGVDIQQGYGMTEASPGVYLAPADGAAQRPVSIGVPHFFTDVTFDPAVDEPLPGVLDCALIAVPDERWGEVGAAFVVSSAPDAWSEESLRAALSRTIAGFKIPKYVHFVEDLPRTATGKVRRQELRKLL